MDKRELNQNGLPEENGRDENLVSLPAEPQKTPKKRRPKKKRPPQSADSTVKSEVPDTGESVKSEPDNAGVAAKKKRRPENTEEAPKRKRRPENTEEAPKRKRRPENAEETPKRKRRPESAEGTPPKKRRPENTEEAPKRKRRPESVEGMPPKKRRPENAEEAPKRKRRPEIAEGPPKKRRRPESAEGTPPKKRRPENAEGTPRKRRRLESAEGTSGKRRPDSSTGTERSGSVRTRQKKKRTYVDVLKDLVVDTSLMAILIKALFCLLLFLIVLFVARGIRNKGKAPKPEVTESTLADESSLAAVQTDLQKKTETFLEDGAQAVDDNSITILGVGDNLVHEQVFLSASTGTGYDFRPFYKNIKPFITSADLATVNQETPLATALGPASGYPHFNTPTEMGDALIDAGFDVANMGNNHMFDMGVDGAYVTREYWDEKNIPCTGFYYGYDDLFDFRIIEKNGIKVAFLSFLEMTNDELPSSYSAIVVYMNDPDLVRSMIEEAKEKADIVVVHAHWGDENTDVTNDYVYNEAQKLVDWGADIVLGNHSHVLQDLVTLTRESDGQKCPVIYSLGNFFSAQKVRDQLVSGILNVQVTKDASGKVKPTAMGFLPIVTHYTGDRENLALYPLNEYSDELARMHGTATVSTDGQPMSMDYIESLLEKHIPAGYLGRMGPIDQN